MKITKVCCQGCGAALDIDESLRFVTCNYCHVRLEVIHDPTTTHTRILEKLEQRTNQLVNDVKVLQLQNDLEQLDREWERYREAALIRGKDGRISEPSVAGSVFGGLFAAVVGIGFAILTNGSGFAGFSLFGLLFVIFGIFMAFRGSSKAIQFNEMRTRYESRRQGLCFQVERARNPG